MTVRPLAFPLALAALLAVAVAQAQTAPPTTDVGPPPAEERASTGAVVLENSPVRAQRDKALKDSSSVSGGPPMAAGTVVRTPTRAQARAARASARAAEAAEFRRRGAGSLTGK